MAMWAVSIPHKSYWDKLRGESVRERVGTLGGDGLVCELLSVISFIAIWAWESQIFDSMIQQGMGVGRPLEARLEAWEMGFVAIRV
jgi:hypothetical protein